MVDVGHLARSLDWKRPRLTAALDAIPHSLQGTGLRLHQAHNAIKIVPATRPNNETKKAIAQLRTRRTGLNLIEARILTRVINNENVLYKQPSNATRVAVGAIKNLGCIRMDNAGVFVTTETLRAALPDI